MTVFARTWKYEFLFVPTWRCNLQCSYCHFDIEDIKDGILRCYGQEWKFGKELEPKEWLEALERFQPYLLECTGGEPLVYKGFWDVVENIPEGCYWAITSNTVVPIEFPKDFSKCWAWTASYHYGHKLPFVKNIARLSRELGHRFRISMVVTPENIDEVEASARSFMQQKIPTNVLRVLTPGLDWTDHEDVWQRVLKLGKEGSLVIEDEIPPKYEFSKHAYCEAGTFYAALMPDGQVFRCYSALLGQKPLGHVRDWVPNQTVEPCGQPCAACALDFRQRKWEI